MLDSDWSRQFLLRSDWLGLIGAIMTTGIIQYATQHNVPGLLLFIPFEKASDSLEWPFIFDTLRFYGFGPSLINWVRTFYCNIGSCGLNNGWSSNFIQPQRGVRQGCPL